MSKFTLARQEEVIALVQHFVQGYISGDEFTKQFLAIRSDGLRAEQEVKKSWAVRYDTNST